MEYVKLGNTGLDVSRLCLIVRDGPDHNWCNADPDKAIPRLRNPERLHILAPGEKYVLHKKIK